MRRREATPVIQHHDRSPGAHQDLPALHRGEALSFKAEPGLITGFLGPNGAGKTTTINMILGLSRPDGGEAKVAGKPFHELDNPVATVGAVLAGGAFHDGRSARASWWPRRRSAACLRAGSTR